jgi:HPt (histidine-containing phosphotransfer) domain-containing protein
MQTIARFAAGAEVRPVPFAPDGIVALRPRYLANRGNDIKAMRAALVRSDFNAIKRIAHDCKGTGTGYGFPEISAIGKALEQAASERDQTEVAARVADMEEIVSLSTP